ncbi:MAG: hypothetical protein AAF828_07565 [Bacteroidota bacterium]
MLSNKDSIVLGLVTGLLIAVAGYFIALGSNEWISALIDRPFAFKESTVALIAICLNLIAVSYFRRRYMNKSLRGLMLIMMTLAVVWFLYYGQDLMG